MSDRISMSSIRACVSPTKTQRIITGKKTGTGMCWNHLVPSSPFTNGERLREGKWQACRGLHILLALELGTRARVSHGNKTTDAEGFELWLCCLLHAGENVGDPTSSQE